MTSSARFQAGYAEGLRRMTRAGGRRSVELFKHGTLQVKVYAPRGEDMQLPHDRDEVYVVTAGRGVFVIDGERKSFVKGDLIFVPAGVQHRFDDFSRDFCVWVLFYGPTGGEQAPVRALFKGVYPIGDTNILALPVKDMSSAIGYYSQVLGFEVVEREGQTAMLRRDEAQIGLMVNEVDPDQASCYFEVSDVDALYAEYKTRGIWPSDIRTDEDENSKTRLFFAKEPYGVCFAFGQPA